MDVKTSPTPNSKKQKVEASLVRFHGEAAASAMENAGTAYQSPSLIASGAGANGVELLAFLTNFVFSLLCIKAPGFIERMGPTKKTMLILSLSNALTWLPLVIIFLFLKRVDLVWLVVLWMINLIPSVLFIPLRDDWLAALVSTRGMGRYLGWRSAISGIFHLVPFYFMGRILDASVGEESKGFAAVFFLACVASFVSTVLYRTIQAPPVASGKKTDFSFTDFVKETNRGGLGAFILYVSLFNLAVSMSSPLFAVYMLKDRQFSYVTFTAIVSTEYLARICSAAFWGRYTDKTGNLKILGIVSYLIPFVPILWLFSSNVMYLIFVQLFSGTVWSGFDLCTQTFIYRAAPKEKRFRYIVYHKGLSTLSVAMGALAGFYLLELMVPVFGSKILGIFLLSGILRLLVVKSMFHKLVDLTLPDIVVKSSDWVKTLKRTISRQGLFYRPQDWAQITQPAEPMPAEGEVKNAPSKRALFYRPQDWARITPPAEPMPAEGEVKKTLSKRALFYRPQDWAQITQPTPQPLTTEAVLTQAPAKKALPSQNHSDRLWGWSRFIQKLTANAGSMRFRQPVPAPVLVRDRV